MCTTHFVIASRSFWSRILVSNTASHHPQAELHPIFPSHHLFSHLSPIFRSLFSRFNSFWKRVKVQVEQQWNHWPSLTHLPLTSLFVPKCVKLHHHNHCLNFQQYHTFNYLRQPPAYFIYFLDFGSRNICSVKTWRWRMISTSCKRNVPCNARLPSWNTLRWEWDIIICEKCLLALLPHHPRKLFMLREVKESINIFWGHPQQLCYTSVLCCSQPISH